MRLLLDSHILYWALTNPKKLTLNEQLVLSNPENDVFVSPASLWELHIKAAKGKLKLPNAFLDAVLTTGFLELEITMIHTNTIATLPDIHNDPFDRVLAAQAKSESLTFVTHDTILKNYPITLLEN